MSSRSGDSRSAQRAGFVGAGDSSQVTLRLVNHVRPRSKPARRPEPAAAGVELADSDQASEEFLAAGDPALAVQRPQMFVDGERQYGQLTGDLLAGQPVGEQAEDFVFACGELVAGRERPEQLVQPAGCSTTATSASSTASAVASTRGPWSLTVRRQVDARLSSPRRTA
jgi:hypothetical protein